MSGALFERRAGSGSLLVLVHGFGVSSHYFIPALRELSRDFACRAPDLPGYGRSVKPRDALNVAGLADALLAWLDGPALVLANSFGCQVALEAAVREPARVRALVLVGPTYDPRLTLAQSAARLARDAVREQPSLLRGITRDYVRMGPRRLVQTALAMPRDPVLEKLRRVDAPTLVVRGERDAIVSQSWTEHMAALLPRGRLAVVPGAAHAVHWSHPAELRRLVLDFVEEVE